jgi:hypothetical protein|tara:strand:+ start:161 stop:286 length:126 start_codon:yes stop_codon:yes gene_type:complete
MSERQESIIRSQAILMFARNRGNKKIHKRIIARFAKCIKGE